MSDCCMLISMLGLTVMTGFYIYCGIECFIKPYIKEETKEEIEKDTNKNIELKTYSKENQPLLTPTICSQPYKT